MKLHLNKKRIAISTIALGLALVSVVSFLNLRTSKVRADAINTTDFVITVKTDNPGSSTATQFRIPTAGTGYNYNVDCNNDGIYDATGQTSSYTCDYTTAGTYTIRIGGTFPRIYFNNAGDRQKLLEINQWGDIAWTSMQSAFYGASNMDLLATDTPNLAGVTNLGRMFVGSSKLIGASANWNWDTSSVTNMTSMFSSASAFNQPLDSWDMSSVTNVTLMLDSSGLSTLNYDRTLKGWATQMLKPNLNPGASGRTFCFAEPERASIISTYNWTFSGDSKNCSYYKPTTLDYTGVASIDENSTTPQNLGSLTTATLSQLTLIKPKPTA